MACFTAQTYLDGTYVRNAAMTSSQDAIELRQPPQAHSDTTRETDCAPETLSAPTQLSSSSPSATHPVYSSSPLGESPTAIRILEVAEQHDGGATLIRCNLRVVDLADRPRFTALSYVWGDPANQETIWCCDQPLRVTRNAWEALRRLRNKFPPLNIWIDAICINQEDESEKSHQIPLMRAIYSSAIYVYVWLGEGNSRTDRAMHFLSAGAIPFKNHFTAFEAGASMDYQFEFGNAPLPQVGRVLRLRLGVHMTIRRYLFQRRLRLHRELSELFANPWISRVWTLQEVLLAHSPILVCGNAAVPWFAFLCAVQLLEAFREPLVDGERAAFFGLDLPPEAEPWLQLGAIWKSMRRDGKWNPISLSQRKKSSRALSGHSRQTAGLDYGPSGRESHGHTSTHTETPSDGQTGDLGMARLRQHADAIRDIDGIGAAFIYFLMVYVLYPWVLWLLLVSLTTLRPVVALAIAFSLPVALFFVSALPFFYRTSSVSHYEGALPWKLSLITQIAIRKCTQPDDSYYGVLGIIRPDISHRDIDRTKIVSHRDQVYRWLCLDLISWSDSLDFLLFAAPARPADTPSWVVQWHQADVSWAALLGKTQHTTPTFGIQPWHNWRPERGDELHVRAISMAVVESASPTHSRYEMERYSPDAQYPLDDDGRSFSGSPTLSAYAFLLSHPTAAESPFMPAQQHVPRMVIRCSAPFAKATLATRAARIGDRVFVIPGVSLPMLLRRVEHGRYRVVGPTLLSRPSVDRETLRRDVRGRVEEIVLV